MAQMQSESVGDSFVGREREVAELSAALRESLAGHGRLALISGEAGIGKTRLADELAARASALGAEVHWGRCWEGDGAPAFWPWAQVVRSALATRGGESPVTLPGDRAARLAQIAPDLPTRLGVSPDALPSEDAERARFLLFDALTACLSDWARRVPIVVILDDLHCADQPSLRLLKFVCGELRHTPMLLVGVYREIEARRSARLRELLGDLAREAIEVALQGFDDGEVERFITSVAARTPHAGLVHAVRGATGGNPFFVSEMVRLLSARDREGKWTDAAPRTLPLPPSVRATIRRRLDGLPDGARELLAVASFVGRDFDLVTLERASGLDRESVLDRLGDAIADDFVRRVPNAVAVYRFAHDLVRETVYDDATPAERARRHRRVGETIEELHRGALEAHVAELAHHFGEAAAGGDGGKALAYSMRAGQRANAALAYEEAVEHFEQAKRLVTLYELGDESFRFELLLELGEAQKRSGDVDAAKATFGAAAAVADELASADRLARVALAYPYPFGGFGAAPQPVNEVLVGWLRRALAGVASKALSVRSQLLSRLAIEIYFSSTAESHALGAEAVRLARGTGDGAVLSAALMTNAAVVAGTGPPEESLTAVDEVMAIAEEIGRNDLVAWARFWRIAALYRIGDRAAIDGEIAAQVRIAEALREPRCRWIAAIHQAARDLPSLDSAEAEKVALRTLALGESSQERMSGMIFGLEMLDPLREQGRLAEVVDRYRSFVEENPSIPAHRAMFGWIQAELGQEEEARLALEAVAARGFADVPRDNAWSTVMALFAEVADRLGDLPRAAALYDLMLPFAAEMTIIGPALVSVGSFAHYLGVLARRLGRHDAAREHLQGALEVETKMGAERFIARTELELARVLLASGDAEEDRAAAIRHLDRATAIARRLGMNALLGNAEALREEIEGNEVVPAPVAPRLALDGNLFRHEGDYWTIAFEGETVRLRDTKGLRYIAHLLRDPGRELHVTDLVGLLHGDLAARANGGDAGEILDQRARDAYRRRADDLRCELEEAERFNDSYRATLARQEIEQLGAELAAAVGLGGRERRASSDAERARLMVTQRIRSAIRKMGAARPALGRHFDASIRTGSFCAYAPQSPVLWRL